MSELPLTIAEAGAWLRGKRITATKLTETMLARAEAAQGTIGAFIRITGDAAMKAAREADAELARGDDRGPLHGIPIGIKDIIATSDAPSTANSRVLDPKWGQRHDATVVRKLREAGAISLGKLGLHEYAYGWPDPDTGFRVVKNPWDLGRTPGGSSSGTGAAIAAGLILGGLGTDTGGSIRGPAAYCSISGIKATFGRVSKEGCVPLGYSLDNIGPMARSARDCALMLQVMAGYDPADPCSADKPVPDYAAALDGSLAGVRVGLARQWFFDAPELDAEQRDAALAAIDAMGTAGARVVELTLPYAAEASIANSVILRSEALAYHEKDLQTRPELYGRWTRQALQLGALLTAADYMQAQRLRSHVIAVWNAAMVNVDVIVVPTSATPPATFAEYNPDGRLTSPSYTGVFNMTGMPAMSVPCGFTKSGLPIGMQIVGRAWDEATVFKVGDAYQRLTDWHLRTPPSV